MYKVLYRKYRPQTFDEVVGQEHITETLKNEIESNKIAHAYLFTGIRGTGKTTCAKILAKAINCLSPINGNPCGECEACIAVQNEETMDIVEMDAAGNNSVENIRNIIEESIFTPATLKKRVYIIDEVHMLSIGAFNAFLKTLEEPNEHVVFILATTEIHKIPATILSRCQRFDFYRISIDDMSNRLLYIAESEGISLSEDAAKLISKVSNGALRDALSVLDRCIMNSAEQDNSDNISVTYETVSDTVGLIGKEPIYNLAGAIIKSNSESVLQCIADLYGSSKNLQGLLKELLEHFRDIMLYKITKSTSELSADSIDIIKTQAEDITLKKILSIMDGLELSDNNLKKDSDSRTAIEVALLKLCNIQDVDNSEDNSRLFSQIKALEREISRLKSENTSPKYTQTPVTRIPKPKSETNTLTDMDKMLQEATPCDAWDNVLKEIKTVSPSMSSAFHGSKAYVYSPYLFIESENELAFVLLRQSNKRNEIRNIIEKVTGQKYKLGPYKKPEIKKADNKKDPLDELCENAIALGVKVDISE